MELKPAKIVSHHGFSRFPPQCEGEFFVEFSGTSEKRFHNYGKTCKRFTKSPIERFRNIGIAHK